MPEIVLTEEQARVLAGAATDVVVRDPAGATVGVLDPREAAALARHRARRAAPPGPRYTEAQARAGLEALEAERARIGRFDVAYAQAFLRRLEAADPARYGPTEGL